MNRVLEIAQQQVGIKEYPANSNNVLYNTWFYGKPVKDGFNLKDEPDPNAVWPWCGTSVSWIFDKAGVPLGNIGWTKGFSGCSTALEHFKKTGEVIARDKVQPGDLFIVDWNGDGRPDHTGIVKEVRTLAEGGDFVTLEGNTSNTGSQSNGGEYMEKLRHFVTGKAIWYFIHPKVLDKLNT